MRTSERELHACGQRRLEVEVVTLGDGGGGLVDLLEYGRHALRRRRSRGQKAHVVAALLERPVGDQAMQMHVQAEVAAESLHRRVHASVELLANGTEAFGASFHISAHLTLRDTKRVQFLVD